MPPGAILCISGSKATYILETLQIQVGQFLDRKSVEEKLRINMQRLTLATQSAQIGIWDFDVSKNQVTWSDEMFKIFGVRREDFEGTYESWKKCILPEDEGIVNAEVLDAISGKKGFHTEFRLLWPGGHADGKVRYIEAHATVISGDDSKPQYMTGVNWDITGGCFELPGWLFGMKVII